MKLYAFQPEGHGPLSFFVVAESEEAARKNIDDHIKLNYYKDGKPNYYADGWPIAYILTVGDVGEIIENDNS